MKYFLHDTNSFQDEKITELFIAFGYEGLGLFYTILEKLAMQEKPVKTVVLKRQLSVGKKLEKVWSFLEEIELIYSNNGETFNENILKFSEKYQIKKEKTKERVAKWRDNQEVTENVTRYTSVSNTPKVKESKVKEEKEEKENGGADAPAPTTSKPSTLDQRKAIFRESLGAYYRENPNKYPGDMYSAFINYWAESDGKKMRYEKEKVFEIPNRLSTWHRKEQSNNGFNGKPLNGKPVTSNHSTVPD